MFGYMVYKQHVYILDLYAVSDAVYGGHRLY